MSKPIPRDKLLEVSTRKEWRAWLRKNYRRADEVWLVYHKKHTGNPRVEYNDAVEEALCFGWIDSTARTIDDDRFAQRFSPRRPKSNWSQTNIVRLRALLAQGKVAKDVLPTLPDLTEHDFIVPDDILAAIKANREAWKHFKAFSETYVQIRVAFIDAARARPEVFNKRLAYFLRMTEQGKRYGFGGVDKHF